MDSVTGHHPHIHVLQIDHQPTKDYINYVIDYVTFFSRMDGDPSAGNFFKNLFGPNVSIVSSEDANSVVARNNGLSVDEFFQPFSCVGGKEPLTSRDVGGNLHSVSNIKIQFKNLASKIIPQDEIDRRLQD